MQVSQTNTASSSKLTDSHVLYFLSTDQDMDGEVIATAFATVPGPDCLHDVLPKFGVRLKVYSAIKQQLQCEVSCHKITG